MATYRTADKEAFDIIKTLIDRQYPELLEAGVRVGCLFAYAPTNPETGEPKGPALKHHSWPAAALVRITSHKDRVAGLPDAIIYLDGKAYSEKWSEVRKEGVIAHELMHLEVCRDEDGAIKLDDCHRPKLKMREHDWQISGFEAIARKYKEEAIEVEAARQMADKFGQLLFPW